MFTAETLYDFNILLRVILLNECKSTNLNDRILHELRGGGGFESKRNCRLFIYIVFSWRYR